MDFCFFIWNVCLFHSVFVKIHDMKVQYRTSFPIFESLRILLIIFPIEHPSCIINHFISIWKGLKKKTNRFIVTDYLQIESMKRICRLRLLPPNRDSQFRHRSSTVYALDRRDAILLMVQNSGFHQLRLVVYPIIYRVWDIPGGAGFLPSTIGCLGGGFKCISFRYDIINHNHTRHTTRIFIFINLYTYRIIVA